MLLNCFFWIGLYFKFTREKNNLQEVKLLGSCIVLFYQPAKHPVKWIPVEKGNFWRTAIVLLRKKEDGWKKRQVYVSNEMREGKDAFYHSEIQCSLRLHYLLSSMLHQYVSELSERQNCVSKRATFSSTDIFILKDSIHFKAGSSSNNFCPTLSC